VPLAVGPDLRPLLTFTFFSLLLSDVSDRDGNTVTFFPTRSALFDAKQTFAIAVNSDQQKL
jgi:hypothetical protein